MRTFVIQSKTTENGDIIPAQSYGYTAIEAVEYSNWYNREKVYDYVLSDNLTFMCPVVETPEPMINNYLQKDCIPIGSVEYVLRWLELMGVTDVKPLNIPQELWPYVQRKVSIDTLDNPPCQHVYIKHTGKFKTTFTREDSEDKTQKYFMTEQVENIRSEWRVFILDKKILGIRCYSGNEWILPNKPFVEGIAKIYDKRSYTLDVMVYRKNGNLTTDIVELHDFFACGLYGFNDWGKLPKMWFAAISELFAVGGVG